MLTRCHFAALSMVAVACSCYGADITVHPGDDLNQIVMNSPSFSNFHLLAGVYRMQQVVPRDGDSFTGDSATVLNGSRLLTSFQNVNGYWIASGQTQKGQTSGTCQAAFPACIYPEDLFFDDVPIQRVTSLDQVVAGKWYFDYSHQQIYFADDPTGHIVEVGVSRSAFSGQAVNVSINNLVVEKYAIPAQMGAIGDQHPGTGWRISNVEVKLNHGTGINVGSLSVVSGCNIHNNGQKGVGATGINITIQRNVIAANNYAGFSTGWEAGGTKFSFTVNLLVRWNLVHDNIGPGLWTDIDNVNTIYDSNVVTNNTSEGIKHEISYTATIKNNTVSGNGSSLSVWLWGSQILIQNSQSVNVYNNTVTVPASYGNAIGIIYQNRGSGKFGPRDSKNNSIHDNDITHLSSPQGSSGMVADYDQTTAFSWTNSFYNNHYHVTQTSDSHWQYNGWFNWPKFQSQGFENGGTLDTTIE